MENCINCNKEYTIRGMKIHLNKCNLIYHEIRKKEKEANKIKIVFTYKNNLTLGNYLPDDCVKIIYEYLLLIDNHTPYLRLYNEINNISFTCKNFYINKPDMKLISKNINLEKNETICRSWCKNLYGLNEDDLINIHYNIVHKYHGYTMHLFNIIDIKECAYKKYGTEYDYKKYIINKDLLKSMTKKEKDKIYENRKKEYDILFQTYNYPKNCFLENLYNEYVDYIKKKTPTLLTIENSIQKKLFEEKRSKILKNYIKLLNISYYKTEEACTYIYNNNNLYLAIESIKERSLKEENYNMFINEFNYNKKEYDLYAYEYINNKIKDDIKYLFEIINGVELCKKYIYSKTDIINIKTPEEIQNYLFKIVDIYCDKDKYENIKNIFFDGLSDKIKLRMQNIFYGNKSLNERDILIDNYKMKKIPILNIKCLCNNIGSASCVNFLCKKCCIDMNCKRHN